MTNINRRDPHIRLGYVDLFSLHDSNTKEEAIAEAEALLAELRNLPEGQFRPCLGYDGDVRGFEVVRANPGYDPTYRAPSVASVGFTVRAPMVELKSEEP